MKKKLIIDMDASEYLDSLDLSPLPMNMSHCGTMLLMGKRDAAYEQLKDLGYTERLQREIDRDVLRESMSKHADAFRKIQGGIE